MKKHALTTSLLLLALLAPMAVSADSERIVRIGHAAPTSAGGGLAAFAIDSERGARMAIDEINARSPSVGVEKVRFELISEDDRANPDRAQVVAKRLIDSKVVGVIGHLNSGTSIKASDIYSAAGIPQITPSGTNPVFTRRGLKTTFRTIADDAHVLEYFGRYTVKQWGLQRVAIVDNGDDYGKAIVVPYISGIQHAGGAIVARESLDTKTTDFALLLAKLAEAKPDLVFLGGFDGMAGRLLIQMKQSGMSAAFAGPDALCSTELMRLSSGTVAQRKTVCAEAGGVTQDIQAALSQFNLRFAKQYGKDPLPYAKHSYDAVNVLVDAMQRAQSFDPSVFIRHLAQTATFSGVSGPIEFDAKGDLINGAITLYTYGQGGRELLDVIR